MPELVIPVREYIGESRFNWDTLEMEWATNADDVRMAVEWAQYDGFQVDSICLEMGVCYGGSTFHGTQIYNYLQGLGIPVRTRILSLAASMATVLMLVGTVEMDHTAQLMIHAPSCDLSGTAAKIRSDLKLLDNTHESLRSLYMTRTGQPAEVVDEWMSKDTYLSATEAKGLGLCDAIIPIAPKTATKPTEIQARLTRSKISGIVARAEKRVVAARKKPAPTAALPKPSSTPKPMANKAAAPKAGTKKAAPTAAQKANMALLTTMAKQLGVKASFEVEAEAEEVTAVVESTETDQDGALLYHDGPLAQGSAVFYDEALTEAAEDGTYGLADGRSITVAEGVVESITEAEAAAETEEAPAANADILKRLEALEAKNTESEGTIASLNAELAKFKKAVPPTPGASGKRPTPQMDVKHKPKPKAPSADQGTL